MTNKTSKSIHWENDEPNISHQQRTVVQDSLYRMVRFLAFNGVETELTLTATIGGQDLTWKQSCLFQSDHDRDSYGYRSLHPGMYLHGGRITVTIQRGYTLYDWTIPNPLLKWFVSTLKASVPTDNGWHLIERIEGFIKLDWLIPDNAKDELLEHIQRLGDAT